MKLHFKISSEEALPKSWVKFDWNSITLKIEKLELYTKLPSYFLQGEYKNFYNPEFGLYAQYLFISDMDVTGRRYRGWEYNVYLDTEIYDRTESERNNSVKLWSVFGHMDHFLKVLTPMIREEQLNKILNESDNQD